MAQTSVNIRFIELNGFLHKQNYFLKLTENSIQRMKEIPLQNLEQHEKYESFDGTYYRFC